jgi:hypothetical protein
MSSEVVPMRLILFSAASLVLLPISTLADGITVTVTTSDPPQLLYKGEAGPAAATSGGIYINHEGLIRIPRVNESDRGPIAWSLPETRTRMFNDPTKVTIDTLQSLGEDGEFGDTDRGRSYLFPPSSEDELDSGEHDEGLHKGLHKIHHHHFKGNDSDDFGSHRDVDDDGSDDDDDCATHGPVTEAPEPAGFLLLGTGLLSLLALKKFM